MAKDPAILFYTGDFLNGCTDLTLEERGQYITLLCLQHQKGHLSEKTIRLSVGSVNGDVMRKFAKDENGNFYNERMEDEINKRQHFLDTRYFNGKKGGRPIKPNNKPNKKAKDNLPENRNINEDNNRFEDFWNSYAKKEDRVKCEVKWRLLTEEEKQKCIDAIPAYVKSTPDKQFRKNPATYLNNKSWENEIIIPTTTKMLTPKTYEEMLELTKNNPELWKQYRSVKKEGERKAIFYPI